MQGTQAIVTSQEDILPNRKMGGVVTIQHLEVHGVKVSTCKSHLFIPQKKSTNESLLVGNAIQQS